MSLNNIEVKKRSYVTHEFGIQEYQNPHFWLKFIEFSLNHLLTGGET